MTKGELRVMSYELWVMGYGWRVTDKPG